MTRCGDKVTSTKRDEREETFLATYVRVFTPLSSSPYRVRGPTVKRPFRSLRISHVSFVNLETRARAPRSRDFLRNKFAFNYIQKKPHFFVIVVRYVSCFSRECPSEEQWHVGDVARDCPGFVPFCSVSRCSIFSRFCSYKSPLIFKSRYVEFLRTHALYTHNAIARSLLPAYLPPFPPHLTLFLHSPLVCHTLSLLHATSLSAVLKPAFQPALRRSQGLRPWREARPFSFSVGYRKPWLITR